MAFFTLKLKLIHTYKVIFVFCFFKGKVFSERFFKGFFSFFVVVVGVVVFELALIACRID
jgi:hypothetical protein